MPQFQARPLYGTSSSHLMKIDIQQKTTKGGLMLYQEYKDGR